MKTGFIGLGLIGGSIARAVRHFYPDAEIIAYSRTRASVEQAVADGVVDRIPDGVGEDFADCDYIFLCAPVSSNAKYLEQLKPLIHSSCIITDVGSTKTDIHEKVTELGMEENFIGGHPMAGSEKTGYANSKRILIENAYYMITPTGKNPDGAVDRYRNFVASLKALPLVVDYRTHDYVTAGISHLPHIIASSLVNLVKDSDTENGLMKLVAAGGFKDITRIASSSPEMWEQICMTNTGNITEVLDRYIDSLTTLREELSDHQSRAIYQLFESSRDYRNSFAETPKGSIQPEYAFSADVVDEPGAISIISSILSGKGISIKNIGISHNREHGEGALRISFYDKASMEAAWARLKKYNYTLFA